jgi:hypothetical protein
MADTSNNMDDQTKNDIQSGTSPSNDLNQKGGQSSSDDINNRGLGSDNMDPQTKERIQSEGGKASRGDNK